MAEVKVKTDKKWKDFVYRHDVPEKILKNEFDWLDEEQEDGFLKFLGTWYHTSMFMRMNDSDPKSPLKGWDGYHGDSYFSGVVIKLSSDGEKYKIGRYYS